jgi:hypothetical protein
MNTVTKEAYEGDIVQRLRNWRGLHLAHSGVLFDEAADEIESLRELRKLDGESIGKCLEEYNTMKALCIDGKYLTDDEREAVRFFSQIDGPGNVPVANKRAATLRKLLERLK